MRRHPQPNYPHKPRQPRQPHQAHQVQPQTYQLPIGKVRKIPFSENIPEGWRKMRIDEGREYKRELGALLSQWSIVGFQIGAIVGNGYGFRFWEHYGGECGEGFIICQNQQEQKQMHNQGTSITAGNHQTTNPTQPQSQP